MSLIKKQILFVSILVLCGCNRIPQTSGMAATNTVTPGPTASLGFQESQLTSTVVITPTIPTPKIVLIPPKSAQESEAWVLNNIHDNGCDLPCIWGFMPGTLTKKDLEPYLTNFVGANEPNKLTIKAELTEDGGMITASIGDVSNKASNLFSLTGQNSNIEYLHLTLLFFKGSGQGINYHGSMNFGGALMHEKYQYYLLPGILSKYGKPSAIYLQPFLDEVPGTQTQIALLLAYDQGFVIEYLFPKEVSGQNYVGCPYKTGQMDITSWDPGTKITLEELLSTNHWGDIKELDGVFVKPIKDATGLSIDDFTEKFRDPNNKECIISPLGNWKYH
jgi:hypothetical protein